MDALRFRVKLTSAVVTPPRLQTPLQPDLLLLDEPTNHLDAESVNLEQHLEKYPGTIAITTIDTS
jgi:ATPase subunit of ABC transporter with duplicated ATPase domains